MNTSQLERAVERQAGRAVTIPAPSGVRRFPFGDVAVVLGWAALVVVARWWGDRVVKADPRARIFAAPLVGRLHLLPGGWKLVPAVALAGVVVLWGRRAAVALTWRRLLLATWLLAAAWAVCLAASAGVVHLWAPLTTRWDYLHDAVLIHSPLDWLRGFVSHASTLTTHVRAHPPGMPLLLWALARAGLGGARWEAALVIAAGAAVVPAALVALAEVTSRGAARRAAPFLVLAPFALWVATSADALFAGVAATGVALVVLATGRRGTRADILALTGGVLLGCAMFLSYATVLVLLVPVVVAASRRRARPLVLAAGAAALVVTAFGAGGFWWWDGLRSAHAHYVAGSSRYRPQGYFVFGNLAAFALALGPAAFVGLRRLRGWETWLLPASALVAIALADLSGLSKGEVERIWLPFAPWILVSTCAIAATRAASAERSLSWRTLLGLQAFATIAVQIAVRSPW